MTRHQLRLPAPATNFYGSFLLGNGSLGAAVHGRVGTERIDLNLDTFWSGGPIDHAADVVNDPGQWLAPLRRAVAERRFEDADDLAAKLQSPRWTQSYQPLGALTWPYSTDQIPTGHYERVLDLATAVSTQSRSNAGKRCTVTSFVSAPDAVLVVEATGQERPVADASFECPHPATHQVVPHDCGTLQVWTGRAPAAVLPVYVDSPDAVVYATDAPDDRGTVAAGMGFAVAVLTQVLEDGSGRVLVSAVDGYRGRTERPSADLDGLATEAIAIVEAAAVLSTTELRQRHEDDHRSLFDRVDLDLSHNAATSTVSPADAELFFDLGRYLLIAGSRIGTQPTTLQGLWNQDIRPGWSCNYTTNINLQMNYWGAHAAGLGELAEPLERLVDDLSHLGEVTAQGFYGARGWTVHHNSDLWGFTAPVSGEPQWSNWPLGGAWLLAHLRDRDTFRPDAGFRRDVLRPATVGAASFLLDLLVEDDTGLLVTSPSTSPEHRFIADGGRLAATSAGTAMDQTLVRDTLSSAITLSLENGDEAFAAECAAALDLLRPLGVDDEGRLLEWADERVPEDRGHRHLSHLYALFPGASIDEWNTPRLYKEARRALADRVEHGSGHTGWSQAWILALAARTRDTELVEHSLDILINRLTSESLLDLHPVQDHETGFRFQIDGNFGSSAGIVETLLQSQNGVLRLFNAVPHSWATGSARGLRARGDLSVNLSWAPGSFEIAVTAHAGGRVVVCVPAGQVTSTTGQSLVDAEAPEGRRRVIWDAETGERLVLSR